MSEQEFEVYLRLIARLLRLSDAQREAISDELRDHMEARLNELMDAGIDREKAIHAAIEEFGDAAGLAEQFTRITKYHKLRRHIMRTSIGALATAAAVALAFLFMLPQNRPGVSGPAESLAQETAEVDQAVLASTEQSADTLDRLSQKITVDFQDTPLENAIDYIREATGVNIFVNWTLLETAGVSRDVPVSLHLKRTSATTVLSLLSRYLSPMMADRIDYAVTDDVVVISISSEISDMRVVRIYDCVDLMKSTESEEASASTEPAPAPAPGTGMGMGGYGGEMGGMGGGGYGGGYGDFNAPRGQPVYGMGRGGVAVTRSNELTNVVYSLLDDGGTVSSYDGMLVVVAGHKVHQRIHETLNLMRDARANR